MPRTYVVGVGDPISIPPTPAEGQLLWVADVPAGAKWTLENLIYDWGVPDSQAGQFIFHIFVKDSFGNTLSPIWDYAWLQSQHPEWWRPIMRDPHMPIYGPATVSVVVVNISPEPASLYWTTLWSFDP